MGVNAFISIGLSTSPTYPSVTGTSQATGGVSNAPIPIPSTYYPAASVNTLYTLAFPYATLQTIVLLSNKGMTLKFNSTGSPTPTIVLQPNSPFYWNSSDGYYSNPFTANITGVYVSCTPASTLSGFVLCS